VNSEDSAESKYRDEVKRESDDLDFINTKLEEVKGTAICRRVNKLRECANGVIFS
jgi:hypothetical protein